MGADERCDGHPLGGMVRERGVAGTEVDRVEATGREVGDVRPRLLRSDHEVARRAQGAHERRVEHDARSG